MQENKSNHRICLEEYISEEKYKEINKLQELCALKDKVNLKLELDYKIKMHKDSDKESKEINEFLYYVGGSLIGYLGISSFGGNISEINGMVHPEWRRQGIFKKLFQYLIDECRKRNFSEILLLSDNESESGVKFIKDIGGIYDVSEYRMKLNEITSSKTISPINLRKAKSFEKRDIERQNEIFFYGKDEGESIQETYLQEHGKSINNEEPLDETAYMAENKGQTVGKIHIDYSDDSAFIFGFGILPQSRGKGYGKEALKLALQLIEERNIEKVELDVACKNDTALNLYKSLGFQEESVMNYYKYNV